MRILMSSSTIDRGNGYGNITYELVRTLSKAGIEVTLLLPNDSPDLLPVFEGVTIEKVLPKYLFQALRPELIRYFLWRYRNEKKYDLVHSLFETPYAPLMAREAKRRKIPFVMGAQGTYGVKPLTEFPERYFLMYAYNTAKAIHVPSEYTKRAILEHARMNLDITIIHNGIDYQRIHNAVHAGSRIKALYAGKNILLTVGQLKNRKGQDLVIRALPEILKDFPDTIYIVVGTDGWNGYLKKLAQEQGVAEHVFFVGAVPNDEVPEYFYACDIYMHTPRIAGKYFFEGFGIVYLEAGACGKPAIGTDAGGIKDALVHEKTGFVARDESVEEIILYTKRLLSNPDLRRKLGESAQEYAQAHDWDSIAQEYIQMYSNTLESLT